MSDDGKVVPLRTGVEALKAFIEVTSFGGDTNRPFVGQPWTWTGERGKTKVTVSLRDIGDAIVRGLRDFPFHLSGGPNLDALAQSVLLQLEQDKGLESR